MSKSEILTCLRREQLGTRPARKLRAQGRIPASLQAAGKDLHVDFSVDEREFLSTRRRHTHLYDLEIGDLRSDVDALRGDLADEEARWKAVAEIAALTR